MAISLSEKEILSQFDNNAKCRVNYQNMRKSYEMRLWQVEWKYVQALTVLYDEPKVFMNNGDACKRDGVRIVVKK